MGTSRPHHRACPAPLLTAVKWVTATISARSKGVEPCTAASHRCTAARQCLRCYIPHSCAALLYLHVAGSPCEACCQRNSALNV